MNQKVRKKVHVVPHTHYDAEVFLSREETFERGFHNIERALRMLAGHGDFTFVLDQVCYVQPYLARYPEKRAEVMGYVKEGRLVLEGALYAMPDMNLPGGESFIRQVIRGREYFQAAMGVDARCAWTLDSFGYHPQVPQILAGCGFDWNIIQRGTAPDAPADFLWQGIDGTRLYVHCMPLGYTVLAGAPTNIHEFRSFVDNRLAVLERDCEQPSLLALAGADITPPEAYLPAMMKEYNAMQDDYELVFSTPQKYFDEIMEYGLLPAIAGDFNGVFHGCYSARIAVKQRNRRLETELLDGEKVDAIASLDRDRPSVARELNDAWEPVLFNQFHDIICGSHVDSVYESTLERFDFSEELAQSAMRRGLQSMADETDTGGPGISVIVWNTLGHARSDPVETAFSFTGRDCFEVEVRNADGVPVPSDLISAERDDDGSILRARVLFIARDVPSFGYETYRIIPLPAGSPPGGAAPTDIRTSVPLNLRDDLDAGFIENGKVKVSFDLWRGVITSMIEKTGAWDAVSPASRRGNTIVREQDFGNFWQYNGPCKGDLFHPPMEGGVSRGLYPLPSETTNGASFSHLSDGDGTIRTGKASAEFSIDHPWGNGFFATRVRLYAGLPRVEVTTTLVNEEERVRYRAAFPSSINHGTITHEIPFGAIQRPEGEYPAQTWMDLGKADGSRGIALLNQGLPGNNVAQGVLLLSLLKCTALKEGYGESGGFKLGVATEQGYEKGVKHELRYAYLPHAGDWRQARIWEQGHGFNTPLIAVKTTAHAGALPPRRSWIAASDPRVVLSAVRRGKKGIVVRVYEAAGDDVKDARISLAFPCRAVEETNLVEDDGSPLVADATGFAVTLGAFQIRTFQIVP